MSVEEYDCKVIADSVNQDEDRLITWSVTFPRYVLAEFNTHGMLSRNSASSRAIPGEIQIQRVRTTPFVPFYWGRRQAGMVADAEVPESVQAACRRAWINASRAAAAYAEDMILPIDEGGMGLHKQVPSRLLEPFLWHTAIVTATEVRNFFNLRTHKAAAPEIRRIAEMMYETYAAHTPRELVPGDWHLPLVDDEDRALSGTGLELAKVSANRCKRVSFAKLLATRPIQEEIIGCDDMIRSGHMSPLQHPARAFTEDERVAVRELRWFLERQIHWPEDLRRELLLRAGYVGQYKGFVMLRKTIPGEDIFRPSEGA